MKWSGLMMTVSLPIIGKQSFVDNAVIKSTWIFTSPQSASVIASLDRMYYNEAPCTCETKIWSLGELSRKEAARKSETSMPAVIQFQNSRLTIRTVRDIISADVIVQYQGIDVVVISVPEEMDSMSSALHDK
jgi:hypothetical protein